MGSWKGVLIVVVCVEVRLLRYGRVNTLRTTMKEVVAALEREGFQSQRTAADLLSLGYACGMCMCRF